ncbi:MAG TPA: hypothetical protein VED67_05235, partial [Thermodesulfovibrionales bacterium]|nr:hypothetical protein [Thermodesulfovibrionales bacterium]
VNDSEKLKHLLNHWMVHNLDHAEIYREWAAKTASSGNDDLSKVLEKLCDETKKLNILIEEALKKV